MASTVSRRAAGVDDDNAEAGLCMARGSQQILLYVTATRALAGAAALCMERWRVCELWMM